MKKKILIFSLIAIVCFSITGCDTEPYYTMEAIYAIDSVELVTAESSLDYTVIKRLSELEEEEFIDQLKVLNFSEIFNDPSDVSGDCIKITYYSGAYEMFNARSMMKVQDGNNGYVHRSCDDEEFQDLFHRFLKENIV